MSDYRELIAQEQGVEQYCHCQSCGSKAELNENSEGTLWYKCTECGWRKRWDSNPRTPGGVGSLANSCNRPLCHVSIWGV